MGENVYLDKVGYQKILSDISNLEMELDALRKNKSDDYENGGDGFHDNFAFEEAERRERALIYQIAERKKLLERVILIDSNDNKDIVDINDLVSLTIDFGDDKDTANYRLVSSANMLNEDGIIDVSINSPLGKAIYLKKVGDETNYIVNGSKFSVFINAKIDETELLSTNHIVM